MRHSLSRLALSAAAALALACGATGPSSQDGLTACDQLRECACDPDRTSDPDACNLMVDALEQGMNPQTTCAGRFQAFGCGRQIVVAPGF